ncbi:unnamed protein product [Closterium sp. NIES-54]
MPATLPLALPPHQRAPVPAPSHAALPPRASHAAPLLRQPTLPARPAPLLRLPSSPSLPRASASATSAAHASAGCAIGPVESSRRLNRSGALSPRRMPSGASLSPFPASSAARLSSASSAWFSGSSSERPLPARTSTPPLAPSPFTRHSALLLPRPAVAPNGRGGGRRGNGRVVCGRVKRGGDGSADGPAAGAGAGSSGGSGGADSGGGGGGGSDGGNSTGGGGNNDGSSGGGGRSGRSSGSGGSKPSPPPESLNGSASPALPLTPPPPRQSSPGPSSRSPRPPAASDPSRRGAAASSVPQSPAAAAPPTPTPPLAATRRRRRRERGVGWRRVAWALAAALLWGGGAYAQQRARQYVQARVLPVVEAAASAQAGRQVALGRVQQLLPWAVSVGPVSIGPAASEFSCAHADAVQVRPLFSINPVPPPFASPFSTLLALAARVWVQLHPVASVAQGRVVVGAQVQRATVLVAQQPDWTWLGIPADMDAPTSPSSSIPPLSARASLQRQARDAASVAAAEERDRLALRGAQIEYRGEGGAQGLGGRGGEGEAGAKGEGRVVGGAEVGGGKARVEWEWMEEQQRAAERAVSNVLRAAVVALGWHGYDQHPLSATAPAPSAPPSTPSVPPTHPLSAQEQLLSLSASATLAHLSSLPPHLMPPPRPPPAPAPMPTQHKGASGSEGGGGRGLSGEGMVGGERMARESGKGREGHMVGDEGRLGHMESGGLSVGANGDGLSRRGGDGSMSTEGTVAAVGGRESDARESEARSVVASSAAGGGRGGEGGRSAGEGEGSESALRDALALAIRQRMAAHVGGGLVEGQVAGQVGGQVGGRGERIGVGVEQEAGVRGSGTREVVEAQGAWGGAARREEATDRGLAPFTADAATGRAADPPLASGLPSPVQQQQAQAQQHSGPAPSPVSVADSQQWQQEQRQRQAEVAVQVERAPQSAAEPLQPLPSPARMSKAGLPAPVCAREWALRKLHPAHGRGGPEVLGARGDGSEVGEKGTHGSAGRGAREAGEGVTVSQTAAVGGEEGAGGGRQGEEAAGGGGGRLVPCMEGVRVHGGTLMLLAYGDQEPRVVEHIDAHVTFPALPHSYKRIKVDAHGSLRPPRNFPPAPSPTTPSSTTTASSSSSSSSPQPPGSSGKSNRFSTPFHMMPGSAAAGRKEAEGGAGEAGGGLLRVAVDVDEEKHEWAVTVTAHNLFAPVMERLLEIPLDWYGGRADGQVSASALSTASQHLNIHELASLLYAAHCWSLLLPSAPFCFTALAARETYLALPRHTPAPFNHFSRMMHCRPHRAHELTPCRSAIRVRERMHVRTCGVCLGGPGVVMEREQVQLWMGAGDSFPNFKGRVDIRDLAFQIWESPCAFTDQALSTHTCLPVRTPPSHFSLCLSPHGLHQAEADPSAVSVDCWAAGVSLDRLLAFYLPPTTAAPPSLLGLASGEAAFRGSLLSPTVEAAWKAPQARGPLEGMRGSVALTRDTAHAATHAHALDLLLSASVSAPPPCPTPPRPPRGAARPWPVLSRELPPLPPRPRVERVEAEARLRAFDALALLPAAPVPVPPPQPSLRHLRLSGRFKLSARVPWGSEGQPGEVDEAGGSGGARQEAEAGLPGLEGSVLIQGLKLNQLLLGANLSGGVAVSPHGFNLHTVGRGDEQLMLQLSANGVLPAVPTIPHASSSYMPQAQASEAAFPLFDVGAAAPAAGSAGGGLGGVAGGAVRVQRGQMSVEGHVRVGATAALEVRALPLDELELASLRGLVERAAVRLNFAKRRGHGSLAVRRPRFSGMLCDALHAAFRWTGDVVTLERSVLEQANSRYEVQGEYVLPGMREWDRERDRDRTTSSYSAPAPTPDAAATAAAAASERGLDTEWSGGGRQRAMPGQLQAMMTSIGRWRLRLDVPHADVSEMLPGLRILSRSHDPAVLLRSKELFLHGIEEVGFASHSLQHQLEYVREKREREWEPAGTDVGGGVAAEALPGLVDLRGRWHGVLEASGGGNGDTSASFDVHGSDWEAGRYRLQQLQARGRYSNTGGLQVERLLLQKDDGATVHADGTIFGPAPSLHFALLNFPAHLVPTFLQALHAAAPSQSSAAAAASGAPFPPPPPVGVQQAAVRGVVHVEGDLSGSFAQPQCDVQLRLLDGEIAGVALGRAEVAASLTRASRLLFHAVLEPAVEAGQVRIKGNVPLPPLQGGHAGQAAQAGQEVQGAGRDMGGGGRMAASGGVRVQEKRRGKAGEKKQKAGVEPTQKKEGGGAARESSRLWHDWDWLDKEGGLWSDGTGSGDGGEAEEKVEEEEEEEDEEEEEGEGEGEGVQKGPELLRSLVELERAFEGEEQAEQMQVEASVQDAGMMLLTALSPSFRWIHGHAAISAQVSGTLARPEVAAEAVFSRVTASSPVLPRPLTGGGGRIRIAAQQLLVDGLEGRVGRRGTLRVEGSLPLGLPAHERGVEGAEGEGEETLGGLRRGSKGKRGSGREEGEHAQDSKGGEGINITAEGLEVRARNVFSGLVDAGVSVMGSLAAPEVTGAIRLSRGIAYLSQEKDRADTPPSPSVPSSLLPSHRRKTPALSAAPSSAPPAKSAAPDWLPAMSSTASSSAMKLPTSAPQQESTSSPLSATAATAASAATTTVPPVPLPAPPDLASAPSAPAALVRLRGLQVALGPELRVVYPLILNLATRGDLHLNGFADPRLVRPSGTLFFENGEVNLVATQLRLNRDHPNCARFEAALGMDPLLDLKLVGADWQMRIQGPANRWQDHVVLTTLPRGGEEDVLSPAEAARLFESQLAESLLEKDGQLALKKLAAATVETLMPKIESRGQFGQARWRLVSAPQIPNLLSLDPTSDPFQSLANLSFGAEVEIQIGNNLQASVVRQLRESEMATQWKLLYQLNSRLRLLFSSLSSVEKRLLFEYSASSQN